MVETTRSKIVALLLAGIILLTMFAGCSSASEDVYQAKCSQSIETNASGVLEKMATDLLSEEGYKVTDTCVNTYLEDGIPSIYLTALIVDNEKSEVKTFKVETEYDGPIMSAFNARTDRMWIGDQCFNAYSYLSLATYNLDGDKIVVSY